MARNSHKALIAILPSFFFDPLGEGLIRIINRWEKPVALIELSMRDISALITPPKTKSGSEADRSNSPTKHRGHVDFLMPGSR